MYDEQGRPKGQPWWLTKTWRVDWDLLLKKLFKKLGRKP